MLSIDIILRLLLFCLASSSAVNLSFLSTPSAILARIFLTTMNKLRKNARISFCAVLSLLLVSLVFLLWYINGVFNDLSKQLDTSNCLSKQLDTSNKSIKLVSRTYKMGPDFFPRFFPSSQSEEFPHHTLILLNIKKENNLSNRIRRNSQNATTIKTDSLNYTIHNNFSSSTTPLSLLVNQTSKTTKKNHTSEKYDNNIMSVTTPSIIGKNIENLANFTTLTNNSLSGIVEFNSLAEKEEERKENSRGIDVWTIGSLLFFVFFMVATAYYYMSNISSRLWLLR
ncbi:uncharacterized protein LOC126843248 isoform X2 [Adelges cooleyi]|uniref:uncharacterized protein LOC126843248 isoform X2 n=1 Tax=Adelges cooleyi TaxID=133065 RepID=UPI00218020BA|nr:uncharacterized protein LOC126843248 isoform X2 [Adelges cooleyi]